VPVGMGMNMVMFVGCMQMKMVVICHEVIIGRLCRKVNLIKLTFNQIDIQNPDW
jgi:hypothetical protein